MKIGVATLKDRPTDLTATETPAELGLAREGADFFAPVDIAVHLIRMQEDVLAKGRASTRARLECSRCLEPVEVGLEGEFEALYVPETGPYAQRRGRRNFEWGDQRVNFYTDFTIDLADEICQCLLLELPMKPLCRADCAGLCPACGADLNQGPCGCETQAESDDPFSVLRDLFPPEDEES